jgi:hypothetical protein
MSVLCLFHSKIQRIYTYKYRKPSFISPGLFRFRSFLDMDYKFKFWAENGSKLGFSPWANESFCE